MTAYQETLDDLLGKGRLRSLRTLPEGGCHVTLDGKDYLNFSSNDYLSLSHDNRVKEAAAKAALKYGSSASSARLVTGDLEVHAELEDEIANYLGLESALVFGSGFLTNIGVLTALADRNDVIFSDKLNHASLIDGASQSRAKVCRYKHNDSKDLLRLIEDNPTTGQKLIVTESIFSMDGDKAPLKELSEIAITNDAVLIIDEAHALGVYGPGLFRKVETLPEKLVIMGTFSKSLASYGGFAACSKTIRSYLINKARSFIFSTALPPSCCAAALEALKIIKSNPKLGEELLAKAKFLYNSLSGVSELMLPFESQIIPIIVNDDQKSLEFTNRLFERNIICSAIRPPTVPENTARLRLSVNLGHTEEDLKKIAFEISTLSQ
jgi:8-amino-7-oxononanoate synthase